MAKANTKSFTLTARLIVNDEQINTLKTLFNIACHIQNVMVKHAQHCLNRLERDPEHQELMHIYSKNKKFTKEEKEKSHELILKHGLSEFDFHAYVAKQNRLFKSSKLGINQAQKIASRVWSSVEGYLFKDGEYLHFKKRKDFKSIEGKSLSSGIRYKNGRVNYGNLSMLVRIQKKDTFLKNNLKEHRIKYCRIIRKWHKHSYRYYVQFIMEGVPSEKYRKHPKIFKSQNNVGIDLGPSTVAAVSKTGIIFTELAHDIEKIDKEIARLQRHRDRQLRIANPDNYNADGTIKRNTKTFKKTWKYSRRERLTYHKIKELYRIRAEKVRQSHTLLANAILSLGTNVFVEKNNIKSLQKRTKKTEISTKTGKYKKKKRFGKSIQNHAPSTLMNIIKTKLSYIDKEIIEVDSTALKASQFNHITGEFKKAELNERWKELIKGILVQRDLYSAFLLAHVLGIDEYDFLNILNDFEEFKVMYNEYINELRKQKKAGKTFPSCMGI